VVEDPRHRRLYEGAFGAAPDLSDRRRFPPDATPRGSAEQRARWLAMAADDRERVNRGFANLGKALAAYECRLTPGASRFDRYVEQLLGVAPDAEPVLGDDEIAGLRLFIDGRGQCLRCHNGPLLTNGGFHNIGLSRPEREGTALERGRADGVEQALADEFNCLGAYSDARPEACRELRFVKREGIELPGAFKVPTLRNVGLTAPYMHAGQLATLRDVLVHYSEATPGLGHQELTPRRFGADELRQLEAFLRALDSPVAGDPRWLAPPQQAAERGPAAAGASAAPAVRDAAARALR
jgi:cytochrome c peroxidase